MNHRVQLVGSGLLDVIDDEDLDLPFCVLELQPELFPQRDKHVWRVWFGRWRRRRPRSRRRRSQGWRRSEFEIDFVRVGEARIVDDTATNHAREVQRDVRDSDIAEL